MRVLGNERDEEEVKRGELKSERATTRIMENFKNCVGIAISFLYSLIIIFSLFWILLCSKPRFFEVSQLYVLIHVRRSKIRIRLRRERTTQTKLLMYCVIIIFSLSRTGAYCCAVDLSRWTVHFYFILCVTTIFSHIVLFYFHCTYLIIESKTHQPQHTHKRLR
jgi:small-conductance mechanosensitive channel